MPYRIIGNALTQKLDPFSGTCSLLHSTASSFWGNIIIGAPGIIFSGYSNNIIFKLNDFQIGFFVIANLNFPFRLT